MSSSHPPIRVAAVVAAAGRSQRMGQLKQLLPWGETTVIAAVVQNLAAAGAEPVVCVLGHRREEVAQALANTPAHLVHNEEYRQGEMLSSYQAGVRHLLEQGEPLAGTLLALGDQPHIPVDIIRAVVEQAQRTPHQPVVPSYAMRRGHPFYLPAVLWPELLALGPEETLRALMRRRQDIVYVPVESDAILRDMDTPDEYQTLQEQLQKSQGRKMGTP
ncbi:MAG: glycosyl transferase [Litorilinea sp.]|nr:MAG: glycosyl transferase [Litorilinea sp.]